MSGLPKEAIGQLQNIQNAAARLQTKTRRGAHITPIFKSALAACEVLIKDDSIGFKSIYDCAPQCM
jgi:hypothetical protein